MLPTSNLIDDLACVCDELALEIGDIYLFEADPNTALEPKELWILFQDWTPQGIRYESCTADFVHYGQREILHPAYHYVRPASRDEVRDFSYGQALYEEKMHRR